jgi:hypothetical protein
MSEHHKVDDIRGGFENSASGSASTARAATSRKRSASASRTSARSTATKSTRSRRAAQPPASPESAAAATGSVAEGELFAQPFAAAYTAAEHDADAALLGDGVDAAPNPAAPSARTAESSPSAGFFTPAIPGTTFAGTAAPLFEGFPGSAAQPPTASVTEDVAARPAPAAGGPSRIARLAGLRRGPGPSRRTALVAAALAAVVAIVAVSSHSSRPATPERGVATARESGSESSASPFRGAGARTRRDTRDAGHARRRRARRVVIVRRVVVPVVTSAAAAPEPARRVAVATVGRGGAARPARAPSSFSSEFTP